jgi:hypothetical protein
MKLWGTEISGLNLPFSGRQWQARRVGNIGKTRACPSICNALSVLVGFIILSTYLACDAGALAFAAEPPSQAGAGDMPKNRNPDRKTLITDEEVARIQVNAEKFDRLLGQLDQKIPARTLMNGIFLDVTEIFRSVVPASENIQDAIIFFEGLGVHPFRTSNNKKYYVVFNILYDRLVAQNRTHFKPGDVLGIRYTVSGPEGDAKIESLNVVLMNDRTL